MTVVPRQGIPFRPDVNAIITRAVQSLTRAVAAEAIRYFERDRNPHANPTIESILKKRWPDDHTAWIVSRTASGPAMASQATWAAELAQVGYAFLQILVAQSAGAAVLTGGLNVSFNGAGTVRIPGIEPGQAGWVAEGQPIRVIKDLTSGPTMTPYKIASIAVLSREMIENANVEQFIKDALIASCAPALDSVLLSSSAASSAQPAGMLLGATAVTASSTADPYNAMGDDLSKLAGAIAAYGGNGSFAYVAHPTQALRASAYIDLPVPMYMSASVPVGTVIAVALSALASAVEAPIVEAMKMPSVQFDDSVPQPPTVPLTKNLFQADCVGLRIRLPASWVIRDAHAVAVTSGVKWRATHPTTSKRGSPNCSAGISRRSWRR
jgi:hypothetical protein